MVNNRIVRALGLLSVSAGLFAACSGFLDVSDPQNFTDSDLDQALDAVARGVEGDFHNDIDDLVEFSALLGDEWQHTGTWAGWDDLDHGRIQYSSSSSDGADAGLLRARFAAQDAAERFTRVLTEQGSDPNSSPLMAQVKVVEGMIDLVLAENFCESPDGQAGAAVSDQAMYQQALTKLQAAKAIADAAGSPNNNDYAMVAQAGIARANLMLGNLAAALTAAQAVPTTFTYNALFALNAANNGVVNLATFGFNNAGGLREKWWSQVDLAARKFIDPFTGELDSRIAVRHDAGVVGVDGITPHYSQWKYTGVGSDIEIIGGREMRLIEAEVNWRNGAFQQAVDILNALRADVGLSAYTPALNTDEVFTFLLHERFAENFMEAHRLNDLDRFGLIPAMMAAGEFDSPTTGGVTANPRAIKFPLDDGEAIYNPNIEDNASVRCLRTASKP